MTENEMIELAAKAYGFTFLGWRIALEGPSRQWAEVMDTNHDAPIKWNPLDDDGDALRLLCKRSMRIVENHGGVYRAVQFTVKAETDNETDHEVEIEWPHTPAATRLAITRAAAAFQQCKEG